VALARAIVRQPEPLSNLDAKLRVSTRAQIKHLHHEIGVTTIYVTHDQIEAMTLADRVVVMNKGRIQQLGTPSEIYDNPSNTFVAAFIGSPAMNLLNGDIAEGVFTGVNTRIEGFSSVSGAVMLGFRAEDAAIAPVGTGEIKGPIYSIELLGDATLVTVRSGESFLAVKANKGFRAQIGDPIGFTLRAAQCHLFDREGGERIAFRHEE
jgi:multiple sugar transport system ATP-binding protein